MEKISKRGKTTITISTSMDAFGNFVCSDFRNCV
jgi:hypothetical protein